MVAGADVAFDFGGPVGYRGLRAGASAVVKESADTSE